MRVFLSWSGPRSRELAQFLNDWLPKVIQAVEPWMSEEDIGKGERWQHVMDESLEKTQFGVFCLTPENLNEPWVNFEAGAITKQVRQSKGWTILLDLSPSDVPPPLGKFQHTVPSRKDVRKLLAAINNAVADPEKPLEPERLDAVFEKFWPEFEDELAKIKSVDTAKLGPRRNDRDLLEEILGILRRMENRSEPELNYRALSAIGRLASSSSGDLRDHLLRSLAQDEIPEPKGSHHTDAPHIDVPHTDTGE